MTTNQRVITALEAEFDVEYVGEPQKTEVVQYKESPEKTDAQNDYDLSREVLREMIDKGKAAVADLSSFAKDMESPQAYEVMSKLMKSVTDTASTLYDLQKKTKELNQMENEPSNNNNITVERAVFVGSPSDMLRKIKQEK